MESRYGIMGFNVNMLPDGHDFKPEKGLFVDGFTFYVCQVCRMEAYRYGTATYMKVKAKADCLTGIITEPPIAPEKPSIKDMFAALDL